MGSDQQFCLRWNNFQSSLLASLPQLLDADDLTDVTLSAGGRNIRAHRVVLSACSQYFKDLFREMQSFQHPVIVLPQTTFSDLCSLVTFMYSGEVNIYQDQLAGLLSTADVLHIRGLAEVPHANGTPLKKKVNEESVLQEPITTSQSLHRKKISGLTPSTPNESHAQTSLGKVNRLEKSGKLIPGKKRAFEREELEESEPPFVQVKVEQGIEGIDVESPIIHHRKSYHHHHAQVLHPVQPLVAEKQDRAPQGGDSFSLPHPTEEAVGIEGEVGYPEGNQAPAPIGTTIQGHHSSSEDSGGGGSGGGNTAEPEHHSLGQGPIQKLVGSNNGGNSSSNSKCFATCFVCGKQLSNQYNLKVHLETHQNVCHSCPVCDHVSRSRDALRKHMAYKHTDDRDRFISWKMSSGTTPTSAAASSLPPSST
ncbi:hypothetical protein J437_LFUL003161 [Ladona fulva]|uniref:Uncharacterized protein n=1 Tax=Ladona fulva TaxID=123851 RepID=A0A8K0KT86_LADFU|nr:hypothetical protein J437_LFUL003161 [Ladona fulva]